jgi:RIO-like serine/threonine protein kinase
VNHSTYVNWRQTRGEKEYLWLKTVRQIGLAAPRPIAFASRGRFFGPCWLVMAAIPRHRSLIHVCRKDDGQREVIFGQLAAQIRILIRHGIWHRDLHPGNVLVDQTGTPHLIDFDKARYCNHRRLLTARYVKRWQRAIAKHGLPRVLAGVITTKTIGP